ncbi:MAG: hypothetical protein E4H08_00900 [Candidatus Atribacteria bacterium]|nr:MAG: hypothetical protein E4H08_00900 [Candidatus Atribacteria bacterium]
MIGVLIPALIWRVTCGVIGLAWTRRRRRETFRHSLRRAGLTADEADRLAGQYNARIPFRELLRQRHRFGH